MIDSSSALVRRDTDARILGALLDGSTMTRAALAQEAGVSRPTASAAVARLVERGVVVETDEPVDGRGRSRVRVDAAVGDALALVVEPGGVTARRVDVTGRVLAEHRAVEAGPVAGQVSDAVAAVADGRSTPVVLATVSIAGPVDRHTGVVVELPDEPLLLGRLDVRRLLDQVVPGGDVLVDNDVNWIARGVEGAGGGTVVVLYLGEGLGGAVVADGRVVRGTRGLAGEIAHVCVAGPGGVAMPFTEVFARLGLRRGSSSSIDVDCARRRLADDGAVREVVAVAVVDVVRTVTCLLDPERVVLAGPLAGPVADDVRRAVADGVRPVRVDLLGAEPGDLLESVGRVAVERLRERVLVRAVD